jgi:hypothetical protein
MFTNAKLETSCKNEHEPAKMSFIVFITPGILNKNGGDRYKHTYIMIYLVTLASSALAGFHEGRVLQNT